MTNYSIVDLDYVGLNRATWTDEFNPKVVDLVSFVPLYVRASQILASSDLRELELMKARNEALYYDQVSDDPDDRIDSLYDAEDFVDIDNFEKRSQNVLNVKNSDLKAQPIKNTIDEFKTSVECSEVSEKQESKQDSKQDSK